MDEDDAYDEYDEDQNVTNDQNFNVYGNSPGEDADPEEDEPVRDNDTKVAPKSKAKVDKSVKF